VEGSRAELHLPDHFQPDTLPAELSRYGLKACYLRNGAVIAHGWFPGVHPAGPFHMKGVTHAFPRRISDLGEAWKQHVRAPPDLAVLASSAWDLARLRIHEPRALDTGPFSQAFLQGYMANLTQALRLAQSAWPEARMWGLHTSMMPRVDLLTGKLLNGAGSWIHVKQLDAGAAAVARQHHAVLFDYAQLADHFMANQSYLSDNLHFTGPVSAELANIYLNAAAHRRKRHAAVAAGSAAGSGPAAAGGAEDGQWRRRLRANSARWSRAKSPKAASASDS
jgi:hypothetical protein